ncbi:hypothetical protein ACQ4PT_044402 [Festuca glaucescens]
MGPQASVALITRLGFVTSSVGKGEGVRESGKEVGRRQQVLARSPGRFRAAARLPEMAMTVEGLAGLACMFSTSILLQILACALYNNWWPMLAALMYIIVPMPCLFFGDGSTRFLSSGEGGAWINAAKFLTGASAMGSLAIPAILRHAGLIETGAMFIEFTSFFILVCTVLCFHRATLEEEW